MLEIVTLLREIVNQIMGLFVQFHRSEEADFDSMETQVRSVMLEIGRLTLETIVRVRGTGYSGKRITTPTGEKGKYREIRSRTMGTLMGKVEIRRAYYHLGKGKGGYVPLDESLSLPQEHYSYAVQEQMGLYAIEDSYEESAKKLRYTFPIDASGSTVGRISKKHGLEIYQEEINRVESIFSHRQPLPEPEIESVERGYTGTDGVMVPTVDGYREMKVITTYNTSYAREALAENLYYHALFAEPEVLGEHLWVLLKQRGIYDSDESIWCCDGAKWIWRQKQFHDPEGKEIVDFIHASEYLEKIANAIHGDDTEQAGKCYGCMKAALRRCGGESVLSALEELSHTHALKELTGAITYYQNNYARMDYPAYEADDYHITSSTVESACRHVVGDRLKRSGMRWTIQGAQHITLLRLKWKNGRWKDYWARYRPYLAA
jgi:hypothetical protein